MKGPGRKTRGPAPGDVSANFTRGFVATALLTAIQSRWNGGAPPPSAAKVLRYALQGGIALAAGASAAGALQRGRAADAAVAVAGGAAGLIAVEYLLNPPGPQAAGPADQENSLG